MAKKFDKQEIADRYGLDLENLHEKEITHEDNPVTKNEVFEHLTKKQKGLIEFHHKDGLTWQDLDPRLNRYNSVRYQFIKNCGHFIGEETKVWHCWVDGCNHFQTKTTQYYITFGDTKRELSSGDVRPDDVLIIGLKGTSGSHILSEHPEAGSKRLGKMGVKITRS